MRSDVLDDKELLALLQDLVRIPSVNPELVGDSGGEADVARFARGWLTERGVNARLEEAVPGRPNVVAEIGGDAPILVLCGHIDTVSAEGMEIEPFAPRVEGRRVYGRGACDMKGGVAAIMAAAAALAREELSGRVLIALVVDEEHSSIGADHFVGRIDGADACIVTEPTEGALGLAHKGFVWSELVTRGVAAHGSRPDLGVSAIGRMGRIIAGLERYDTTVLRKRIYPQLGPASMHASLIEGGSGISTYAAECRLKVERRTHPGESPDDVAGELQAIVHDAGEQAEIEILFHREPLVCPADAPIARCVREAAAAVTGDTPNDVGVSYWADSAVFAAAGIPAVVYGPSGEGAHGAVEWVDLDSVVTCARVLIEAALGLANYF